jgi:hypothetical protein
MSAAYLSGVRDGALLGIVVTLMVVVLVWLTNAVYRSK